MNHKDKIFIPIGYTDAISSTNQSIELINITHARLAYKALEDVVNWILLDYMPHLENIFSSQIYAFSGRSGSKIYDL